MTLCIFFFFVDKLYILVAGCSNVNAVYRLAKKRRSFD